VYQLTVAGVRLLVDVYQLTVAGVRLLVEMYQLTVAGTEPLSVIRDWSSLIGHVHLADHPGRREPGTGIIDFEGVLTALREVAYGGHLGLEYHPTGPTEASLDRVRQSLKKLSG
jgi:hydroxypyruvate isomerase